MPSTWSTACLRESPISAARPSASAAGLQQGVVAGGIRQPKPGPIVNIGDASVVRRPQPSACAHHLSRRRQRGSCCMAASSLHLQHVIRTGPAESCHHGMTIQQPGTDTVHQLAPAYGGLRHRRPPGVHAQPGFREAHARPPPRQRAAAPRPPALTVRPSAGELAPPMSSRLGAILQHGLRACRSARPHPPGRRRVRLVAPRMPITNGSGWGRGGPSRVAPRSLAAWSIGFGKRKM